MSKDHSTKLEDIAGEIFYCGKPFTITTESIREALIKLKELPTERYVSLSMADIARIHYGSKVFEEEIYPILKIDEKILRQGLTGSFDIKNG